MIENKANSKAQIVGTTYEYLDHIGEPIPMKKMVWKRFWDIIFGLMGLIISIPFIFVLMYSCPICLIMEFVVIVLKKSVVRSIKAAPLRSGLIKSKLARNSATLKLIPYFLVNVKVKLWLLLWSVRVA